MRTSSVISRLLQKIKGFLKRARKGLYLSLITTSFVWQHKKLALLFIVQVITPIVLMLLILLNARWLLDKEIMGMLEKNLFVILFLIFVLVGPLFIFFFILNWLQLTITFVTVDLLETNETDLLKNFKKSSARFLIILKWTLIELLIRILSGLTKEKDKNETKSGVSGILTFITGFTWAAISFFIYPIMAFENIGIFQSLKQSINLLKKAFGETAGASLGFFVLGNLLTLLMFSIFLIVTQIQTLSITLGMTPYLCILLTIIFMPQTIITGLETVFTTAVYQYIHGKSSGPFSTQLIETVLRQEKQ